MMNKLLVCVISAACALGSFADAPARAPVKKGGKAANSGGLVLAPITGKRICVLNEQKIVSESTVRDVCKRITEITWVPLEVSDKPIEGSPVTITLIDSETEPRMLVAPEDGWSKLNLRKLLGDSPSESVTSTRLKKEMWRVFSYTMGAGNPIMQPALLRVVKSNAELDKHKQVEPYPDALTPIQTGANSWGLDRARIVTYRRACQEGWAHMPTNDIQRAVWEDVHALPTEPIKIKPESKPVKD